jgi:HSP20 family molecular chaperone IbpA
MPNVMVHPAEDGNAAVGVRRRAFELFEKRGRAPGGELDDWLQAQNDLFVVLHAEVSETAKVFRMKILTSGFDAGDLEVIARPQELWVEAKTEKQAELYRQYLTAPIETDKVTARIEEGELVIEAPKRI